MFPSALLNSPHHGEQSAMCYTEDCVWNNIIEDYSKMYIQTKSYFSWGEVYSNSIIYLLSLITNQALAILKPFEGMCLSRINAHFIYFGTPSMCRVVAAELYDVNKCFQKKSFQR